MRGIGHRYELPVEDDAKWHFPWVVIALLGGTTLLLAGFVGAVTVLVNFMSAMLVAAQ